MGEDTGLLTGRGYIVFRRVLYASILMAMFSLGFWMLNQVLDSVAILDRSSVDVPGFVVQIDVWTYHDAAYALLWSTFVLMVLWEIAPWKPGQLTTGRVLIALIGFAFLTAGLWVSQDIMNATLILHKSSVDLPFFLAKLDLYQSRDLVMLLTVDAFAGFYAFTRVARAT